MRWRLQICAGTGFEDVFEEMGGAQPGDTYQSALYRNPGNGNHSLTLVLEGVKSNRMGFGAKIDVTVREPGAGVRHIFRTVGFGSSFGGNPLRQHIGIGLATLVEDVKVTWPGSGTVDQIRKVAGDKTYRLREGSGRVEVLPTR